MEIIEQLVSQLGVTNEQAEGGVGALFNMAKEQLGEGDFSQVANLIPGLDDLMGKAPEAPAEAAGGGGVMGMLGGVADAVGMGDAADKLGGLANLTSIFEQLGLDAGMLTSFISTVLEFVKSKGGDSVAGLLQNVLK